MELGHVVNWRARRFLNLEKCVCQNQNWKGSLNEKNGAQTHRPNTLQVSLKESKPRPQILVRKKRRIAQHWFIPDNICQANISLAPDSRTRLVWKLFESVPQTSTWPGVKNDFFFSEKKPGTSTSMVYPKAETSPPLEERISKFKKTCA